MTKHITLLTLLFPDQNPTRKLRSLSFFFLLPTRSSDRFTRHLRETPPASKSTKQVPADRARRPIERPWNEERKEATFSAAGTTVPTAGRPDNLTILNTEEENPRGRGDSLAGEVVSRTAACSFVHVRRRASRKTCKRSSRRDRSPGVKRANNSSSSGSV